MVCCFIIWVHIYLWYGLLFLCAVYLDCLCATFAARPVVPLIFVKL